jgi:hypothetical protein
VLVVCLLPLIPSGGAAARASEEKPPAAPGKKTPPAVYLADLIPQVGDLSVRLVELEQQLSTGLDLSAARNLVDKAASDLEENAERLKQLKDASDFNYAPLYRLREALKQQRRPIDRMGGPLVDAIGKLEKRRSEWLEERRHWQKTASELATETQPQKVTAALVAAQTTIDSALEQITKALEPILAFQEKAAQLRVRTATLIADVGRPMRSDLETGRLDIYHPCCRPNSLLRSKVPGRIKCTSSLTGWTGDTGSYFPCSTS